MGNSTHILIYRVAKGTLVRRGYFLNEREGDKGEGYKEEVGVYLRDVYIVLVSL